MGRARWWVCWLLCETCCTYLCINVSATSGVYLDFGRYRYERDQHLVVGTSIALRQALEYHSEIVSRVTAAATATEAS